ncbi:hypothetical protein AVEN_158150-1, partial [Araneus ventricosus]
PWQREVVPGALSVAICHPRENLVIQNQNSNHSNHYAATEAMRWLTHPENTLNHGSRTTDTNNHPRLKFVKKACIMKNIIADSQELAQIRRDARRELKKKGSEDDPLFGFEYELSRHQEKIDHAEVSLKRQGPCPIVYCTSHHAPIKDVEMVVSGQYANTIYPKTPSKLTPNNEFKLVSPKKSAES